MIHEGTKTWGHSELLDCLFSEAFILTFHSAVWTEMEEKICQCSHLCTVSNYCLPVLWFRSVEGLLFQHALSLKYFQSICLDAFFWKILLILYCLTPETASHIRICSGEVFNTAAHIWCHSMKDIKVQNISSLVWYVSTVGLEYQIDAPSHPN